MMIVSISLRIYHDEYDIRFFFFFSGNISGYANGMQGISWNEDRPRVKNLGIFPAAKMELTDLTNLTEEGSSAYEG